MSRNWILGAGAVLVVIAALLWWPDRRPAERKIHELIEECIEAARTGDSGGVLEHVAKDFRGQVSSSGESDRAELKSYLLMVLLRGGGLDIRVLSEQIELRGEGYAVVTLVVVFTKGGVGGAVEGNITARHLQLELEEIDGDWKIVSSRHRAAEPAELL